MSETGDIKARLEPASNALIKELFARNAHVKRTPISGRNVGAANVRVDEFDGLLERIRLAELRATTAEAGLSETLAALRDVLATGLNGGNNVRLAFISASQKELSVDSLAKADASEKAVIRARAVLSEQTERHP